MSVLEEIRAKAKALHRTVALPEGNEDRTLKAARMLVDGGFADVILVEDEASISRNATKAGVDLTGLRRPEILMLGTHYEGCCSCSSQALRPPPKMQHRASGST